MNLAQLLSGHDGGDIAIVDRFGSIAYAELNTEAARWRSLLAGRGVGPGDRVALICGNDRHFVGSYLAVLGLGAIAVPLNPASPGPELEAELASVSPAAVVDEETIEMVTSVHDSQAAPGIVERSSGDPAVLLFTSGTAGSPKAAILTHGSLYANLLQIQSHPGWRAMPTDVGLGLLPLFHVFGLNVVLNLSLLTGGKLVLLDRPSPEEALDAVERHQVTLVAGVPVLYAAWARTLDGRTGGVGVGAGAGRVSTAMHSVRLAISGAAPLPYEIADDFEHAFGIPLWEGYGLTEASPVVTAPVFEGSPTRGSVGGPLPGVEVRVVESGGADALIGDPGEVWVRGPNVFAGYFGDLEATERVLDAEGWLHTGDVAVTGEDGCLHLIDRAKDLVIVSGFNVYPQEVERVIAAVAGVAETAVVGTAHSSGGEAVVAYVVRESGATLDESDVIGACRAHLAGYKCPSAVFFVDCIPRAAAGEVLRRELKPDPVS